ncbi:uncharacterized protein im:7152348 isoform X3 [Syngnathus acus]|uniref:uncharacterized protein im:7152348 isoform X3 n=1 Tax=Syngnathus acus TaxID=161584 RepID=UPI001885C9E9|nr:uncharacterized protein im:7152348 isoform X3 [Syngnathus acus]
MRLVQLLLTKARPPPQCCLLPQLPSRRRSNWEPPPQYKETGFAAFIHKPKPLSSHHSSLEIGFISSHQGNIAGGPSMVLCGEGDCGVCLQTFNRVERIPRTLHCRHAFCQACLEAMAVCSGPGGVGPSLSVCCPLCRRVTCVQRGLSLREALWVDSDLWEQIPSDQEDKEKEGRMKEDREEATETTPQAKWNKVKFRSFFRKFTLTKRPRERIMPSSNVEMKSWRRLSGDETLRNP